MEFLLEEYDKLNMDPQTLKSIGEDIATIVQLGGKGIDSVVNVGKSLYSGIKSLGGFSKNDLFFTIDILKKYYPAVVVGASFVVATKIIKSKINDLNDKNWYCNSRFNKS